MRLLDWLQKLVRPTRYMSNMDDPAVLLFEMGSDRLEGIPSRTYQGDFQDRAVSHFLQEARSGQLTYDEASDVLSTLDMDLSQLGFWAADLAPAALGAEVHKVQPERDPAPDRKGVAPLGSRFRRLQKRRDK